MRVMSAVLIATSLPSAPIAMPRSGGERGGVVYAVADDEHAASGGFEGLDFGEFFLGQAAGAKPQDAGDVGDVGGDGGVVAIRADWVSR